MRVEMEVSKHGWKSFDNSGRAQQLALYLVQNAIDELAAILSREFFGDIDGLIDADDWRNIIAMQHFIDGEPQDVAVHSRDARQVPVDRMFFDQAIDFVAMFESAANERVGKQTHGRFVGS